MTTTDIQDPMLRTTLVAVFVYIFTAFYSIGEGPVPYVKFELPGRTTADGQEHVRRRGVPSGAA